MFKAISAFLIIIDLGAVLHLGTTPKYLFSLEF